MKKRITCMATAAILLLCRAAAADPDLSLQDTAVRTGAPADAYAAILAEHAGGIRAYRDYAAEVADIADCRPVGLPDLNGDGIPELVFLDLADDSEYGFKTGRLWIYTADENGVHCALTLRPEIDDLLYSGYYLGEGGRLTLRFSDTERGWIMRLRPDADGRWAAETILTEQEDFSGEGPDEYFLNGRKISKAEYRKLAERLRAEQGTAFGSLDPDNGGNGFTYTPEEALEALASGEIRAPRADAGSGTGETKSRFPELSFFRGSFVPGQKLDVYSAPSARSWRGAKGKAAVTSGSEIYVAGTENGWILVLYELNSGVTRVGYVDSRRIGGEYTSGEELSFAREQAVLAESTALTDDPVRQKTTAGRLKKGTKVTCLAEYNGWVYVEAKVSGKTARGFIAPSALGTE